jgi:hypothetical protein
MTATSTQPRTFCKKTVIANPCEISKLESVDKANGTKAKIVASAVIKIDADAFLQLPVKIDLISCQLRQNREWKKQPFLCAKVV